MKITSLRGDTLKQAIEKDKTARIDSIPHVYDMTTCRFAWLRSKLVAHHL